MNSLHSHWQETDDDSERNVRIRAVKSGTPGMKQPQSKNSFNESVIPQASRRPAAFVGILLFIIVGFAMFQGFTHFSNLGGQVSPSSVKIHIRAAGVDPSSVTVQPGTTITWTNDDTIPHILTSSTFPTSDGKPFATSAIFPGSSTHVLVAANANPGTYTYISKTAQTVGGTIIIENSTATTVSALTQSSSSAIAQDVTDLAQDPQEGQIPSVVSVTNAAFETSPIAVTDSPASGALPFNPHTVGSGEAPVPGRQGVRAAPAITKIANQPTSAPETGSEVWVVISLSIGTLLFITRKSFRLI